MKKFVLRLQKLRQFVERYVLVFRALVVERIDRVLHVAKFDLRATREQPPTTAYAAVPLRDTVKPRLRTVDQVLTVRTRAAKQDGMVARDVDKLTRGLQECI